jgi:hypothetical protein
MRFQWFFTILLLFGAVVPLYSQNLSTLTGTVADSATGEPLIGVNVFLENTSLGAASNSSGFFVVTGIPAGRYTVVFQYIGYRTQKIPLQFHADEKKIIHVSLQRTVLKLGKVQVTAEAERQLSHAVEPSTVTISPREFQKMPAFVESDIFRSLQLLPSVKSSGDYNAALYVRGSDPSENLTLLDGITIYKPYHLFGLFSTFNTDAVKEADFQAGGFSAKYGNRNASVLRVITKDGNRKAFRAQGDVSLLSSKLLLEGPIRHGSFSVAARRTYFDKIVEAFGEKFPYYFYDFQGKMNVDVSANHTLTFMGFFGNDVLRPKMEENSSDKFDFHWGNRTLGVRWRGILRPNLLVETVFSGSRFVISQEARSEDGWIKAENSITDFTLKSYLTYFRGRHHELEAGLEGTGFTFRTLVHDQFTRYVDLKILPRYWATFLQDKIRAGRWTIQPGFRLNYYTRGQRWVLDPRFNVRFRINPVYQLKLAAGHYTQFLTTFDLEELIHFRLFDIWVPLDKTQKPVEANHLVLGLETRVWPLASISVEGYAKWMRHVLSFYPKSRKEGEREKPIFWPGQARSFGLEFLLKKDVGNWFGWLGYSFSLVERRFPDIPTQENWFPASFDRRHSLTATLSTPLTRNIRFGMNYVVSSGNPFTEPIGAVPLVSETGKVIYRCLVDHKNNAHYPPYQRVDVSFKWESTGHKGFRIQPYFQIVNVLNRRNIFFYFFSLEEMGLPQERDSVRGLPIFPTVGVHFDF